MRAPCSPSLLPPFAAAVAQSFSFTSHAPVLLLLMRDLDLSATQAGLFSTATFLAGGLVSVPLGALTDRFGPKRITTASLVLLIAATLVFAATSSYAVMLAMRAVLGVPLATVFVAGGQYVNAFWTGDRRFFAQGVHGGGIQLGVGASIVLLPLVTVPLGWRIAVAMSAMPAIVTLVAWQIAARADVPPSGRPPLAIAFRHADIWRLGLAHTALFGTGIVLATWIAVYLVREFALPLHVAGAIGSLGLLVGAAGRPVGGAMLAARLIGARGLIVATLAATVISLGCLAWPGRPLAVAVAGITIVGIATALGFSPVIALAARAVPEAPAAALGVIGMLSVVAVVVGAPLVGALLGASGGFTVPLAALAIVPAAAVVVSLGLDAD